MTEAAALENDGDSRVHAASMILRLRRAGIADRDLLNAIEAVPRRLFVPADLHRHAYSDLALPIECGQTISPPSVVGIMLAALDVNDRHSVLEIGTGSGYQAAILSRMARRVTTIERFRTLVRLAEARWQALGIRNVSAVLADGTLGWTRQAPFDRIILTVALAESPAKLIGQLTENGVLIAPLGHEGAQRLIMFQRVGAEVKSRDVGPARFLPATPGIAQSL